MSEDRILLDPTGEQRPATRDRVPRLESIAGRTVALLDISKARGDVFLDRIEEKLRGAGVEVLRFRKPTFTKPAPVDLRQEIATRCDAVIEALVDMGKKRIDIRLQAAAVHHQGRTGTTITVQGGTERLEIRGVVFPPVPGTQQGADAQGSGHTSQQ